MRRILAVALLVLCAVVAAPAAAKHGHGKGASPDVIALPNGFQPEGIASGRRHTFYVGSAATGAIYRGDFRTGQGSVLVPPSGLGATGLKVDRRNRLFVSGAGSKTIRVYDAGTGVLIHSYAVPDAGFINDVTITRRGAYFTDSAVKQLYFVPIGKGGALGELRRIPLTGDLSYDADPNTFELNGIEAARGGKQLIAVQSRNGKLFRIDAATGATREITLGKPVTNGDGLWLQGRKLYVVRNQNNLVAVVRLRRNLAHGTYTRELTRDEFAVPTTITRSGGRYYVVNAKFGQPTTPDQTYQVVKVPKR